MIAQLMLLQVVLAAPAGTLTSAKVVERVQAFYDKTRAFSADFSQRYTFRATRRVMRSSGKVSFKKPGMMHWNYTRGTKKMFISDGKTLWIYQPEDNQVMVQPFAHRKLSSSLQFLWGQGRLGQEFHIMFIKKKSLKRPGHHVLKLIPKKNEGYFKELIFVVDGQTYQVRETFVIDLVGNINHMTFKDIRTGVTLKPSFFKFHIPKGANVIYPSGKSRTK